MTWNHDMTAAPSGKTVQAQRLVADKASASGKSLKTVDEFQRDDLILASKCGKLIKSYWIPDENRFAGFQPGEEIIGWMAWPVHPYHLNTDAAISSHRLVTLDGPSAANRSDEETPEAGVSGGVQDEVAIHPATHFHLEDCGSGA